MYGDGAARLAGGAVRWHSPHDLGEGAPPYGELGRPRKRRHPPAVDSEGRTRAAAPPPPPPSSTTGGRAQVAAATAFMAPSNTPSYPGAPSNTPVVGVRQSAAPSYAAAPSYPTATPYAPQYQAQPQRPQPQSAPPKIGCCNCRKVFAVPAGSKIVACPYLSLIHI